MQESALVGKHREANFLFDFAKHGGVTGEITVGPKVLPPQAIITSGIIRVVTAVTSDGAATLQIKAVGADDILASTAKGSLTLDALIDIVPVGTAATSILTTAYTQLTFTVGTADLTAGKVHVCLRYFMSITA